MSTKATTKKNKTTHRMSERTANDNTLLTEQSETEPIAHSEKWLAGFRAQYTPELVDSVLAYAASRASWIARHKATHDPHLARELVDDAVGDTFLGVVTWEPDDVSLAVHLKRVIRSRTSHELERLAKFPQVRINQTPSLDFEREVSEAMEAQSAGSTTDLSTCIDATIDALRALAAGDDRVLMLLDAYGEGAIDCRDVTRVTGMSAGEYDNARRRLMRLVPKLPEDIREMVALALAA
jgi:hypothetical protein